MGAMLGACATDLPQSFQASPSLNDERQFWSRLVTVGDNITNSRFRAQLRHSRLTLPMTGSQRIPAGSTKDYECTFIAQKATSVIFARELLAEA